MYGIDNTKLRTDINTDLTFVVVPTGTGAVKIDIANTNFIWKVVEGDQGPLVVDPDKDWVIGEGSECTVKLKEELKDTDSRKATITC
jgi:hypothetical protein